MRIVNLGSGSKGNSTFLQTKDAKILLDVGFTLSELTKRLKEIGEAPENIDAVIITHEHSDHIKGLKTFLKRYKPLCYIHEAIVNDCLGECEQEVLDRVVKITSYSFGVGDVRIMPYTLPHDSKICLGFTFSVGNRKIAIATDLGYMPEALQDAMMGSDLVYLESNHDKKMLMGCAYPYIVKQRIMGDNGHLSNKQAADVIVKLANGGTRYFVLSHLSENSNTPELAYLESAKALENAGFMLEKDVYLRYSRQDKSGNNFYFNESEE